MSQRTTDIRRLQTPSNVIVRDKQYYFNTLDIEADLLKKASDLAERMMAAFMRENKVEVSINVDDIADRIIAKIGDKMQFHVNANIKDSPSREKFDLDDGPVVFKTDKIEVKGKIGNTVKSGDNISENMDILENLEI